MLTWHRCGAISAQFDCTILSLFGRFAILFGAEFGEFVCQVVLKSLNLLCSPLLIPRLALINYEEEDRVSFAIGYASAEGNRQIQQSQS